MLHTNLPTPYYQISEEALDREIALLKNAMSTHWGHFIPSYSVKTNSLPWLLNHVKERGLRLFRKRNTIWSKESDFPKHT